MLIGVLRTGQTRKNHEIDVPANWMAPLSEFLGQGLMFMDEGLCFQIDETLMHEVQGIVDQLSSLFRRHD